MKKLILKILVYLLPFLVISVAAALSPLHLFYFRNWEAQSAYYKNIFPGPFYPLQKTVMTEEGDMGHGTPYAVKKVVHWETDRYGYRKADSELHPEIVIVGDSNIVGTSVTQEDIFSERLEKITGRHVYPYAPRNINDFIQDTRFITSPPKVVILESIELCMAGHEKLQIKSAVAPDDIRSRCESMIRNLISTDSTSLRTAMFIDRLGKKEVTGFMKARLEPKSLGFRYHDLFFYQGSEVAVSSRAEITSIAKTIKEYHDYFRKKNILFIYMPIPNKETIYADFLPTKPRFVSLYYILQGLKQEGVPTIDLLGAFQLHRNKGGNPYQVDDTHWNAQGVRIAADLAAQVIQSAGK